MQRLACAFLLLAIACDDSVEPPLASDAGPMDAGNDVVRFDGGGGGGDVITYDVGPDAPAPGDSEIVEGLPPVSGGTLEVSGQRVVVGDSDRDMLWIFDLSDPPRLERGVALGAGAEPGRLVIEGERAAVILRGAGQLAQVDLQTGAILSRVDVCDAPRGVASDGTRFAVACAGGSLVFVEGEEVTTHFIARDLRDVVFRGEHLYVSVFRTAEVIILDASTLEEIERQRPPVDERGGVANTAWRMIEDPSGGVWLLYQRSTEALVEVAETGYQGSRGRGCIGGIVEPTLTRVEAGRPTVAGPMLSNAILAVDLAIHGDGSVVYANAGSSGRVRTSGVRVLSSLAMDNPCAEGEFDQGSFAAPMSSVGFVGDQIVAWELHGGLRLVDIRSSTPTVLHTGMPRLYDMGRDLFHEGTPSLVTCASCHGEAGDDGITWNFAEIRRRTQSLRGGLLATAPFHWAGDQEDIGAIMQGSFVERMHGGAPTDAQTEALAQWLDGLASIHADEAVDSALVTQGRELFEGAAACTDCHAGANMTDNRSLDVGTGGVFQVPSLIEVSMRAPYFHDGHASALVDTIDAHTSATLTTEEREAIAAYLRTL